MRRRFLVPEVIQTSAMDCGPAALKALFGGFGIYLSYGRLREASQTDIDGTSIDTLEEVAQLLGMQAVQRMCPADLLLLDASACLPAIVVMRLADGRTHFVVLWRAHGARVQIMDPAAGRVWMDRRRFLESLYPHEQPVPRAAWEEWSRSGEFTAGLEHRLRALGVQPSLWADRAHQDAALRVAGALRAAGKLKTGVEAESFLGLCAANPEQIPPEYWTVREIAPDGEQVMLCGAVLLSASAPRADFSVEALPESLAAVRNEPPPRVWAPVSAALQDSGWLLPSAIALALAAAAAGTVIEALLFRGFLDLGDHLRLSGQRLAAVAAVLVFLGCLLALEWSVALGLWRLGRHLEVRLRTRFLLKIPRLADRYFQSRLMSDMAFRAHWLQLLRQLPEIAGQLLRLSASLAITAIAIAWLYPGSAVLALSAAVAACAVPVLFQPALVERDLRFRELSAALSQFYLDALAGSRAIQAHSAQRTLQGAQADLLGQWAQAGLQRQALLARADAVQMGLTLALVVGLVYRATAFEENPAGLLLLTYWAISIPLLGQQIATVAWSLPGLRNTLLRLLELLGAPEQETVEPVLGSERRGVKVEIERASVVASGHVILDAIDLHVEPGEQVAVVGLSGMGKSSLVGLLLGWHTPSQGTIRVDDAPLDAARLAQLRHETAWIDPQVHLFRSTLYDNLRYGNGAAPAGLGAAMQKAELGRVLERLPDGMQTQLGEGGALVSGGEGQSVRIGRALARPDIRLAILDEPARGLDRAGRRGFLATARQHFVGATLFCITHDISDTLDFDRVLVIEHGRIVEQGLPWELAEQPDSRYRQLLDQEKAVGQDLWSDIGWRRLWLRGGVLTEARGP